MDITTEVVETFENTFEKGNLIDTFSQVGEYALDQASKIEAVKDIPFFWSINQWLQDNNKRKRLLFDS